jgi:hypothetical protein
MPEATPPQKTQSKSNGSPQDMATSKKPLEKQENGTPITQNVAAGGEITKSPTGSDKGGRSQTATKELEESSASTATAATTKGDAQGRSPKKRRKVNHGALCRSCPSILLCPLWLVPLYGSYHSGIPCAIARCTDEPFLVRFNSLRILSPIGEPQLPIECFGGILRNAILNCKLFSFQLDGNCLCESLTEGWGIQSVHLLTFAPTLRTTTSI